MNPQYLETFRRHKRAFALIVAVAVLLAAWVSLGNPPLYRSSASLWSDTPAGSANQLAGAQTPASQEQTMFTELLTTLYFRTSVAKQSSLTTHVDSNPIEGWGPPALVQRIRGPKSIEDRIAAALGPKRVRTVIEGPHILKIDVDATTPVLARNMLRALLDEYRLQRRVLRRNALALSERQVQTASRALGEARTKLADYLQEHSEATRTDPRMRVLSDTERNAMIQLATATERLNQETTAVLSGSEQATLRVVDPPQPAIRSSGARKSLAKGIVGGFFVGCVLCFLGVLGLTKVRQAGTPLEIEHATSGNGVLDEEAREAAVKAAPEKPARAQARKPAQRRM